MSLQKSADSDNSPNTISKKELKRLVDSIPVQRYGDSPTVKQYTDWSRILEIFRQPPAKESVEGVLHRLVSPNLVMKPSKIEHNDLESEVIEIVNSDDNPWKMTIENKAQALHAVSWYRGVRIVLHSSQPLIIYFSPGVGYVGYHVELEVAKNVNAKVMFVLDNSSDKSYHSSTADIRLSPNSKLELLTLEKSIGQLFHHKNIKVSEGAKVESKLLLSGGDMSSIREDYRLIGDSSTVTIKASTLSWYREKLDLILNTLNIGDNTVSEVKTRGIVAGESTVAHRGIARIIQESRNSSVDVESYVYLVSDEAKAFTVPVLEVDTGFVRSARHSTFVMNIPSDVEFYIRQRGLAREDIVKLIAYGLIEWLDEELIGIKEMKTVYL